MKPGFRARVERAVASVRRRTQGGPQPDVAVVLGSGLGDLIDRVPGATMPYAEIDGFPTPTVAGHRGLLRVGEVDGGKRGRLAVAVLAGRFHLYESREVDDVVLPVFLAAGLGVRTLIVTNAAGAVNTTYAPGDLVLIRDHINLLGTNPLIGPLEEGWGPRFPDMTEPYSRALRELGRRIGGDLAEGVYAALSGPSYETPAEIRMLRALGADLVGMSTVPEVIAARFLGLEVLGISCVTNMAAGILDQPLSHAEVVEAGGRAAPRFAELVLGVLRQL